MKKIYLSKNDDQKGPFEIADLNSQNITSETMVWYEGMADWKKAGDLDEFKVFIAPTPPPIKQNTPPPLKQNTPPPINKILVGSEVKNSSIENQSNINYYNQNKNKQSNNLMIVVPIIIFVFFGLTSYFYNNEKSVSVPLYVILFYIIFGALLGLTNIKKTYNLGFNLGSILGMTFIPFVNHIFQINIILNTVYKFLGSFGIDLCWRIIDLTNIFMSSSIYLLLFGGIVGSFIDYILSNSKTTK